MRHKFHFIVAGLVACALAAFIISGFINEKENTFRLKATATFIVNGAVYKGSTVQEYRLIWNYQPQIGNNGAWLLVSRGEGIRVDVANDLPIYVSIPASTFYDNCTVIQGKRQVRESLQSLTTCTASSLPIAVQFPTGKNTRVMTVHAGNVERPGYKFASLEFTPTNESVSDGAIPVLPTDAHGRIWVSFGNSERVLSNTDFKSDAFR